MAESNSSSYAQAGPGSGIGEQFGDIALDVSSPPSQVVSDEPGDNADFVYDPMTLNIPSRWRNREASVQAAQGKSTEEIKDQLREELKAEFEQMKEKAMENIKARDQMLKELTAEKNTTVKALNLALKQIESMQAKLDENAMLKAKDEEIEKLKKELKEKDNVIERLTNEKRKLEEVIKRQDARIEELNKDLSAMQNQHSSMAADLDQCKNVIKENEEKTEELVDKKVSIAIKELENRFQFILSMNVSSPPTPPSPPQTPYKNKSPNRSPNRSPVDFGPAVPSGQKDN